MLIKLFNSVIETPETYTIQMDLNKDNTGLLKFLRKMPFKQVTMLSIKFDTADNYVSHNTK